MSFNCFKNRIEIIIKSLKLQNVIEMIEKSMKKMRINNQNEPVAERKADLL